VLATVGIAVGGLLAVDQNAGGRNGAARTTAPGATAGEAESPTADSPGFFPLPGWETVSTPESVSATAANIALGPGTLAGHVPWDTVGRLKDGDVVLFVMGYPIGESAAVDAVFPRRELPLSLDDAQPGGLEGQPGHVISERMAAQVNGWNIDLLIFYGAGDPTVEPPEGSRPSTETIVAAQEQLARLVIPPEQNGG
jgi:hypothetical protein